MPVTGVNTTIVKKDKRGEKNISQVKYFSFYKKGYYTNKYLDK